MITKFEQLENKIKGIESAKNSPNLDEMLGFQINSKTTIYFPKTKSEEHIKKRLSIHIAHSEKLIRDDYEVPEFIRTTKKNNSY